MKDIFLCLLTQMNYLYLFLFVPYCDRNRYNSQLIQFFSCSFLFLPTVFTQKRGLIVCSKCEKKIGLFYFILSCNRIYIQRFHRFCSSKFNSRLTNHFTLLFFLFFLANIPFFSSQNLSIHSKKEKVFLQKPSVK